MLLISFHKLSKGFQKVTGRLLEGLQDLFRTFFRRLSEAFQKAFQKASWKAFARFLQGFFLRMLTTRLPRSFHKAFQEFLQLQRFPEFLRFPRFQVLYELSWPPTSASGEVQWLACWAHNPWVLGSKQGSANFIFVFSASPKNPHECPPHPQASPSRKRWFGIQVHVSKPLNVSIF